MHFPAAAMDALECTVIQRGVSAIRKIIAFFEVMQRDKYQFPYGVHTLSFVRSVEDPTLFAVVFHHHINVNNERIELSHDQNVADYHAFALYLQSSATLMDTLGGVILHPF